MRRRRSPVDDTTTTSTSFEIKEDTSEQSVEKEKNDLAHTKTRNNLLSFRVAKFAILRSLGFVYLVAFLGAFYQNQGLMGTHGIVPAGPYMQHLKSSFEYSFWHGFKTHPTLFFWIPLHDASMNALAILGIVLSFLVVSGVNSWIFMLLLWLLDFSIVTIAESNSFYAYGWESQLLETGFLAIYLCNLPSLARMNTPEKKWKILNAWRDTEKNSRAPMIILWLFRWLCFRISIGAGLIKIRGSSCWTNKTCLWYHFETQPIPSPLSFIFHFLDKSILTRAVDLDLFVQLYTCWFVLVPSIYNNIVFTTFRRLGGFLQVAFMINIMLSGNFSFLNVLTIIPALACLDDACWPRWLCQWVCTRSSDSPLDANHGSEKEMATSNTNRQYVIPTTRIIHLLLLIMIGNLSVPVVTNLLQWGNSRQQMNASFDRFRLVNTYGAFGSVGETRYEPIISISINGIEWKELELPCKPGTVTRRPCFCAPYHYRLDWNIWFLGFKPHRSYLQNRESWVYNLLAKILNKDLGIDERPWLGLLDSGSSVFLTDSYKSKETSPKFAKVEMYEYRMAGSLWSILSSKHRGDDTVWWKRRFEETLIPPVQLNSDNKRLEYARIPTK